jgi:adenylyltransferase/sulfurtransferase
VDDDALLRYSRHILLDDIGVEGQSRIAGASAVVFGAGGLGAAALPYLASAGVGRITIVDGDTVELSNLQRQIVHRERMLGQNKAVSARAALRELNSHVHIEAVARRADGALIDTLVSSSDVVLDCTDNFETRHRINIAARRHRRFLVSGAAIRFDGQLASFDFSSAGSPCYACVFPQEGADEDSDRCGVMGVFAPLVGVIGTLQAAEALAWVAAVDRARTGRLRLFSARNMMWREVRFQRDPACRVCGERTSQRHTNEVAHV